MEDITRRSFIGGLAALALTGVGALLKTSDKKRTPPESWEETIDFNDFSVDVSKEVIDVISREYSRERETAFLLFADDTGSITKTTNICSYGTRNSTGFVPGFIESFLPHAQSQGFELVGTYHSHVNSREGGGGHELSYDDMHYKGRSENDVLRLLGYGAEGHPFHIKGWIPIAKHGPLGKENKFINGRYDQLEEQGVIGESERGRRDVINLKINPINTLETPRFEDIERLILTDPRYGSMRNQLKEDGTG